MFVFFVYIFSPSEIFTSSRPFSLLFFFNDTATTEIYTLSLHDALPICLQFSTTARILRPATGIKQQFPQGAISFSKTVAWSGESLTWALREVQSMWPP